VFLAGERVVLRPGTDDDLERLVSIRGEEDVAERWGNVDEHEIKEEFVGTETGFVVEVDGDVVGAIQFSEEEEPMYRHAGIDIFIATAHQHRGFGTDAVRTLARYLIEIRGHHRLSIDPAVDNRAAIAAYEKVGFRTVGVMRAYERGPDGTWHDGLLMDLLPADLTTPGEGVS
jgi:aminoglycoside 6'-N-acetyltransferase